tara:strand:+ start:5760 stop:6959 length:1200 start_codon:yes stop_codon:yes gene_type:complete
MSLINLKLNNEQIIKEYFTNLCCDDYTIPFLKGGQSNADSALNNLNIDKYATKRNNVYPKNKRGSSYLSPYIRHGLLSLIDVWNAVEKFEYKDKTKFQDELLWQEFSRHLYAIVGKNSSNFLNYKVAIPNLNTELFEGMNCISTIEEELEISGYMVNQTRMWYASHNSLRTGNNWNKFEDYMFKHLIDGSRFANRLGWQWVMGSQTGKPYGFSKFQVEKRAPELCNDCQLKSNCPIQEWPQTAVTEKLDIEIDLNNERIFGPEFTKENDKGKPSFVWITGESLGDSDPAMSFYDELPVVFIFDKILLNKLQLSTKRINFLLDCLKEINSKKDLEVHLADPKEYLYNKKFASTFAPVPKYRNITEQNIPAVEFPTLRLAEPINFYPSSYSSWKKKIKLKL